MAVLIEEWECRKRRKWRKGGSEASTGSKEGKNITILLIKNVPIHMESTLTTAKRRQPVAAEDDDNDLLVEGPEDRLAWALARAGIWCG